MEPWQWVVDSIGAVLLGALLYGAVLVVRRRVLSRHGGTFELAVRVRSVRPGRGWVLGLGRYHGEQLEWFRIFSPWPRPRRTWRRWELEIQTQREAEGEEQFSLYAGHVVLVCRTPSGPIELAMSPSAVTGFSSWLEAGPPGTDWDQARQR